MPRVIKWISTESAERLEVEGALNVGGWGGFMTEEMGWADYIAEFTPRGAAYHEALKEAILARGLRRGGDWHQSAADGVPLFDDGAVGMFSFRGWGDLMAAAWSSVDGRGYGYMHFYMDSCVTDAGMALSPPL